jgi:guanylate kinase
MTARGTETNGGGQLLIISGPSGSGKTSIIERLRDHSRVKVSVNVTTRAPRGGEVDGRDYTFVTSDEFSAMEKNGLFVETNDVFTNGTHYGSLRSELDAALAEPGVCYIMEVDVIGARNIRSAGYEGLHVFIAPPSAEVLETRLRRRGTDDEKAIAKRLGRAAKERALAEEDNAEIVVNDELETAVEQILDRVGLTARPS